MLQKAPYIFILLALLFGTHCTVFGQDFNHYKPIKCSGEIPKQLLTKASVKYQIESEQLSEGKKRKEKKATQQFLLQSNFTMDAMLMSGKVLFNDEITAYVTKVKDFLLREQPKIRDSIKVFVVRSPMVNAFCTNNGTILVHMGLLAKLKNEAHLAYVLSHEFQHYLLQHPLTRYVDDQKRQEDVHFFKDDSYENYVLAKNRYSREQEMEADMEGLELYLKTPYGAGETQSLFDVLRYSYLPIAEKPWSMSFFETEAIQFPEEADLDTIAHISAPEDYDDSKMSHPNTQKRREAVIDRLKEAKLDPGTPFIFGEAEFHRIQKICRFEMAFQLLAQRQYEKAIFHCHVLLKDNPESFYLKKIVAQSIYGLCKYKNNRSFYDVHLDFDLLEGEIQQLYYFTEWLEKEGLNAVALSYCWRLHQAHPEDQDLSDVCDDLMLDFQIHHGELVDLAEGKATADSFEVKAALIPTRFIEKKPTDSTDLGELKDSLLLDSPTDSPRKLVPAYNLVSLAFGELLENPAFKERWENQKLICETKKQETQALAAISHGKIRRQKKRSQRKIAPMGLDKIIVISPIFRIIDTSNEKYPLDYIASESSLENYSDNIRFVSEKTGLETVLLQKESLKTGDIEAFNDMVLLRYWISEELSNSANLNILNLYHNEIKYLSEKYGTKHIVLNGVINLTFTIFPRPRHFYFNLVFNLEEGIVREEMRRIKFNTSNAYQLSALYYSFNQIKMQP